MISAQPPQSQLGSISANRARIAATVDIAAPEPRSLTPEAMERILESIYGT